MILSAEEQEKQATMIRTKIAELNEERAKMIRTKVAELNEILAECSDDLIVDLSISTLWTMLGEQQPVVLVDRIGARL